MSGLPEQMLEQMLHALRGPFMPDEALLLIGQLFAWHSLAEQGLLPDDLTPPAGDDRLTPTRLSGAFSRLEHLQTLDAFAVAFEDCRESTYARLSPDALTALARVLQAHVMLDRSERQHLAVAWAAAILADRSRHSPGIPLEVAELVVRSLGLAQGQAVHCPGAEMDSVAIAAMKHGYEPFVESATVPMIAAIYAAITLSKMRYLRSDPFRPDPGIQQWLVGVDACATVPPWGQRFDAFARLEKRPSRFGARTSEALGLELAALGPARESAVVLPNSLLAGRGLESELRRQLVENGPLQAVIGFPPSVMAGTSKPFSILRLSRAVSSGPVVFCKIDEKMHLTGQGKIRSRDRRFVGADEILELLLHPDGKFSRSVPREEIIAQDFVLTPERYLSKSAPLLADMWKKAVPLGDLVIIVKPQFLKPDDDPDGIEIQEAIPSEIPRFGYLERVDRIRTVEAKLLDARSQQILRPDDVLLSTKGTIGTVGIAKPDSTRPPLLPSQASVILRLNQREQRLDPRFLVMYLRSPLVQRAIASFAVGGTIPNISLSDLRSLPVWLATEEEQRPFIEAFERQAALAQEIAERSAKQQQIADQAWANARLTIRE